MRLGPALLVAVMTVGSSCTNHPGATTETTDTTSTTQPGQSIDFAELCVHTDPGWRPISVHRAAHCPDGTAVDVQGITIIGADGSTMLCDSVSTQVPTKCAGDGLALHGGAPTAASGSSGGKTSYHGTVSKGVLTIEPLAPGAVGVPTT